jgi:hypothetical protein
MEIIETVVPISIENLKKYFNNKETFYLIDCKNSELKGNKLLTYLSNLDLPSDVKDPDLELVKDYLNNSSLVNINSLENIVIDILLEYKGILKTDNYKNFIKENENIISIWSNKLDSLSIFNMYIVKLEEFKNYAEGFKKDDTKNLEGINFVSLLKHERFYLFYNKLNTDIKFYTHYFNDYMFRGKNLYEFWATSKNPMFLLTWGIAQGKGKDYLLSINKDKILNEESLKNVSST